MAYASWGRRVAARCLDITIVWGSIWIVAAAAAYAADDAFTGIFVLALLALLSPLYYGFLHAGGRGQTLGKRGLRIAVRNGTTRGRLGLGRSLARAYVSAALLVVFWPVWILDSLFPLWDPAHQALHDKIVGSVVVRLTGS